VCLLVLALASCGGAETQDRSVPPLFALDTVLTIDDERLWSVQTVRFLPDRYLVVNGGSRELFLFDQAGVLESRFGRQGQGPGEFGYIADAAVTGDSIYVLDSLLRRLSMFVDGEVHDEWSLREVSGAATRIAVLAGGRPVLAVVRRGADGVPPGPNYHRDSIQFVELAGTGPQRTWRESFAVQGTERMTRFIGEASYGMLPQYRTDLSFDLTPAGVIGTERRSGWVGIWNWNGDSIALRRHSIDTTHVPDAELESLEADVERRARRLEQIGGEADLFRTSARAAIDRWGGKIPRPVFENLKSDGRTIAVQKYEPGESHGSEWLVLDRHGELQGRWILPGNVRLMTIDGPWLAAVARDSLDTESILIMALKQTDSTVTNR
jgi:hypothetical protein